MSDIAPKCKKNDHNVLVLNNTCSFSPGSLDYRHIAGDDNGFLGVMMVTARGGDGVLRLCVGGGG